MKTEKDLSVYEIPQIKVVKLVLEQPIMSSSTPTVTNPDMEWGDEFVKL